MAYGGFGAFGGYGGGFGGCGFGCGNAWGLGPSVLGLALGFNYSGCSYIPYYYGGPTYNRRNYGDFPTYGGGIGY